MITINPGDVGYVQIWTILLRHGALRYENNSDRYNAYCFEKFGIRTTENYSNGPHIYHFNSEEDISLFLLRHA